MPHVRCVAPRIIVDASIRYQFESERDVRPHAGEIQTRAENLSVLELVDMRRARLMECGFERPRRGKAARIADLVAERIEGHRAVAGQDLSIQFQVLVAQDDVVERSG